MALVLFDLDNTLIAGDSDHAWGQFIVEKGLVDAQDYGQANDQFYADYEAGQLDIVAYQEFALTPLKQFSAKELDALHREYMACKIAPMHLIKAGQLIGSHRRAGDKLVIITSTNSFITAPIAAMMGINTLIATEGEKKAGRFTGKVKGVPCYQKGKVTRLKQWLRETGSGLAGSYAYSDSHNDLPLLKMVENPVAVDPDPSLRQQAEKSGWKIMSLR
ncbi:MAG: HAD family hydrolase [Pseudomonadales bacterium]